MKEQLVIGAGQGRWSTLRRDILAALVVSHDANAAAQHEDCKVLQKGGRHMFSVNDFSAAENYLTEK